MRPSASNHPLVVTSPGVGAELTWEEVEQDLERVVGEVQYLQTEQGYRQAQLALGDLVQRLSLSPGSAVDWKDPCSGWWAWWIS
jgi:hypothetical protein